MKAVILIHGFITAPSDFNPIYKYLYQEYDSVYKVILPGHDKKEKYSKFNVSESLSRVLDAYDMLKDKYDRIDVIGFSLGGALATYLASKRKVEKLVLLSPANKYLRLGFFLSYIKYSHSFRKRFKILKRKQDNRCYDYLAKVASIYENNRRSIRMALLELFPHYTIHTLLVFKRLVKKINKELVPFDSKTLICWGELDQLVPYKSIKFVENYARNSKEIKYNDLSHLMLKSINIDKLTNDIYDFLKD